MSASRRPIDIKPSAPTLTLNAECLERRSIRSPGDFQLVLLLVCPECRGSLRSRATVNRELGTIGIERRLDAFNQLMVRHGLRRGGRWRSRLRRWCRSGRSGWHGWRRSGGLVLTRCAAGKRYGNNDSRSDAKVARSCDHVGRPFR